MFGGQDNTLEMAIGPGHRHARGLQFQAERWTSRPPFAFRVDAWVQGQWQEVFVLDEVVRAGARFKSDIPLVLPEGGVERLRFVLTAPENAGILIDSLKLLKNPPSKPVVLPKMATVPLRRIQNRHTLFKGGTYDTHTFGIPAIVTAKNGDVIVACDARRDNSKDLKWVRDIDIVYRRSTDNGQTWEDLQVMYEFGEGRPASDPSLVLDRVTGEIFCFFNFMDQDKAPGEFRLYVQSSTDHGQTWGEPRDITEEITPADWPRKNFKFITSGRAMQTEDGRIVHTLVNLQKGLHLFQSRDHGKSWEMLDPAIRPANESKVIELADGRWMLNARVNGAGFRWVHVSDDQGQTWTDYREDQLVDPGCNASIIRYTRKKDGFAKDRLLFSNANAFGARKNLAVRISYDEGETWSEGRVLDPGVSMYSDMTVLEDGSIGLVYEPDRKDIVFMRFTLEDLTDGGDRLQSPYWPTLWE
jgi:sialidase-1